MAAPTKASAGVVEALPISQITGLQSALTALSEADALRAPFSYSPKSATYTVSAADVGAVIGMDANGGARTVNLPAAADVPEGFYVTVKKTDTSANAVTIDGNASETIDGANTLVLRLPHQSVTIANTGAAWVVVDEANIIEFGSSFDYIRHKSGYMRSWGQVTITPVANTITAATVTFPLSFSTAPRVMTSMNYGSNTQTQDGWQTITATNAQIAVLRTNTSPVIVNWSAEGRWY